MAGKTSVFTDYSAPSVDAGWLNIQQTEQKNLIESGGQTLADGALDQEAISVASYAAQGNVFTTDSGAADAYVLTQVSPFKAPYSLKNGMTITFRAGNANTGAATVNAFGLGIKSIKQADGSSALVAGMISTTADTEIRYNGTNFILTGVSGIAQATTSLAGLSLLPSAITIANNGSDANNDIDFSAGTFQFSDGSGQAVISALTKQLDATWAAGTNQGGLFSGSKASSTLYYCFTIYNPTSGIADCGFDTSPTAANIPSGYTKYKKVGSIRTDGSSNIRGFIQNGNRFYYNTYIEDRARAVPPATPTNITLTVPPSTIALTTVFMENGGASYVDYFLFVNPSYANTTPSATNYTGRQAIATSYTRPVEVLTNSSSVAVFNANVANGFMQILTEGFIDNSI